MKIECDSCGSEYDHYRPAWTVGWETRISRLEEYDVTIETWHCPRCSKKTRKAQDPSEKSEGRRY